MKKECDKRIVSIDLLRIIAIILVVGFHVIYNISYDDSYRGLGFIGISLFIIISGFVLAKKYPKLKEFSLKWFLKRAIKIVCIYYLALIVMVVLLGKQVYTGNGILNLISHFLFLDFLFPDFAYGIISPAWFLIPLMFLYLLYPYLNKYISKHWGFLMLTFFITIAARVIYASYTSYSPVFFLAEFAFGIAIAQNRRTESFIISLLTVFVIPVMVVPFLIFYFLSLIEFKSLPKKVLAFISSNTLVLFLYHEAFLKVGIRRWYVGEFRTILGIIILIIFSALAIYFSKRIEKYLLSRRYFRENKTIKNKNG